MKNDVRSRGSRAKLPVRVAPIVAVAAVVAAAAGVVAEKGKAAPSHHGHAAKTRSHHQKAEFKRPKLRHGVLTVTGTEASERIALRLAAGRPEILEIDVGDDGSADFSVTRERIARIAVYGEGGDDVLRIDEENGVFTDVIPTTLDGGDGSDNIAGGSGAERLQGGDGNDSLDGNKGNDIALLGAGDDTFVWDPGDGSDTVEGEDGSDTMVFNGANIAERVDLSANGNRLRFFRDIGTITMDTDGVETVDFNALGGTDTVTVTTSRAPT
jgi:Ca2+-binding RTX toxin-like protein